MSDKTKKLLGKYLLARIAVTISESGVRATAWPATYNPIVHRRRDTALTEAAEAAGGSITVAAASEIAQAATGPVAEGKGATIEDALLDLERALKAL